MCRFLVHQYNIPDKAHDSLVELCDLYDHWRIQGHQGRGLGPHFLTLLQFWGKIG